MGKFSLPLTNLIHENLSIIMSFAFSRGPLKELLRMRFEGEWKYLRKALFEISEQQSNKACLELALFFRLLDDDQQLSVFLNKTSAPSFGRLIASDKPEKTLTMREVCNKIIHASELKWDFSTEGVPLLICISQEPSKWLCAEIDLVALAAFCGNLMG